MIAIKKQLTLGEMELTKAELVGIFWGDENFSAYICW